MPECRRVPSLSRPAGGQPMWMRVILCAASLALASEAHAAGTAYGVDTAEVSEAGNCKIESWLSWASNRDFIGVANPSCVVDLTRPVELSVQLQRSRADGEWSTSAAPKLK